MAVEIPLDHLAEVWPSKLRGCRLGAVLHPASVTSKLEHASRILGRHNGELFKLVALFGPQHGYLGQTQDNMIEWKGFEHPDLRIPIFSLYGEQREPSPEMLQGIDVLIIDLQDIGSRYYTFIWTLYLCLRASERAGIEVVVLDRPNPINGITTEGPILNPEYRSFVGMHPIPVRHGLTIGELATKFRNEQFQNCQLTILPMQGWDRAMWLDETALPWVMPSPNMPTLDTATVYPGMCLLEGTNVSEGRGTTRPFEVFGAPFIDAEKLCRDLNSQKLPGVTFRENYFQPTFHKFSGEICRGAQLHVTDRNLFQPFATGVEVIKRIRRFYPDRFQWREPPYEYEWKRLPIEVLIGGPVDSLFPG